MTGAAIAHIPLLHLHPGHAALSAWTCASSGDAPAHATCNMHVNICVHACAAVAHIPVLQCPPLHLMNSSGACPCWKKAPAQPTCQHVGGHATCSINLGLPQMFWDEAINWEFPNMIWEYPK